MQNTNIMLLTENIIIRIFTTLIVFCMSVAAYTQTGTWSGNIKVQWTSLPIVFHLDKVAPSMDSPALGVREIPMEVERNNMGGITIRIASIGATYEGVWMKKKIIGTFSQRGTSLPLTLTPGEKKNNRPQTPEGPFPYSTEEVSFSNGDAVLKGTLTLPQNYSRSTPILIMVTGSGLQNRDEEIFEHKPFSVIADAFAREGIATLRYDDRGFGESSGDIIHCTTEDLKNDALAGIKLLRERFDNVGVLGHSEGGTIAMMLAADGKADFIVSLAGMCISAKETLLWQKRVFLPTIGFSNSDVETYCALLNKAFDCSIAGKPLPKCDDTDLPDVLKENFRGTIVQLQSLYMKYLLSLDAREYIKRIKCPVLALNGTMDFQVECRSNLRALEDYIPKNTQRNIVELKGLNHMFQHCKTGSVTEYPNIEETFAPEALETMIHWVNNLLKKG